MTMVGNAVELAGIMSDINKLNITIESRIVISTNRIFIHFLRKSFFLRNVNFSPLSGGRRKPRTVIKLIKTHGTRRRRRK